MARSLVSLSRLTRGPWDCTTLRTWALCGGVPDHRKPAGSERDGSLQLLHVEHHDHHGVARNEARSADVQIRRHERSHDRRNDHSTRDTEQFRRVLYRSPGDPCLYTHSVERDQSCGLLRGMPRGLQHREHFPSGWYLRALPLAHYFDLSLQHPGSDPLREPFLLCRSTCARDRRRYRLAARNSRPGIALLPPRARRPYI